MKEFVAYTVARLSLFAASWGVIVGVYLLVRGHGPVPIVWPVLVAALVSALLSAYLLRGLRERFALQVQRRAERMTQRFEELRAKEDVD